VNKQHSTAIYWFRRAIRLEDNQGFCAAVASSLKVIPVFILDDAILTRPDTGKARVAFLFEALADLDAQLRERGGRLIIRHGDPAEELERLVAQSQATGLYFGRDYEPYSRERDSRVSNVMQKCGVAVETFSDHLLTEPGMVMTKVGTPYTVFTPYRRVWLEQPVDTPISAPERVIVPDDLTSEELPVPPNSGQSPLVRGTAADAQKRLSDFIAACLGDYDTDRDFPALEGTSRLSAHLRMGTISARCVLAEVRRRRGALNNPNGADVFLSELAWRDFYYQLLYQFPYVAGSAFKPIYNNVQWENNEDFFAAWCEGRTGYPIVDAAMRQLQSEAWMHNRARMIVASFLTKDLLIDWRLGEAFFMQKLVDGDQASNNGGWQWSASTGADAQPYFRIFNPSSQGEKFDPEGTYVKRWLPELRRIPPKYIHKPWELSAAEQKAVGCELGKAYPHPIVDHKIQRERILALYKRADKNSGNEAEPEKE
jgi:deoxyribodipyrimidine photo-lyase